MRSTVGVLAAALAALAAGVLTACSTTTGGTGRAATSSPTETPGFPSTSAAPTTSASTPSSPPPTSGTTSPTSTIHPAPAQPIRTVTVHAVDGTTYVVKIWWEVQDPTCADHAYGQVMIDWLTRHPCTGLTRFLGTTTVNGRPVGFAESATGFPGRPGDLYGEAAEFTRLEEANGTGSIDDLLRDGYRLPSGPTSIPAGEAFNVLGQDQGVTVWDAWYLDGPTPDQAPALIKMTQDIFLQF